MLFSVGATGGADGEVVVVVVVVVVVAGGAFSSLAQAAIVPIAMMAPMPATAESRRGKRSSDVIVQSYLCFITYRRQCSAEHTQS
jgi:hypothetical protein